MRGNLPERDVQAVHSVCKHYVNRAKFKQRGSAEEFVVTLADGCASAQASLSHGSFRERQAAMGFLLRLVTLRDTVIDMNMERVFGKSFTPFTRIAYEADGRSRAVRRVSAMGEYLIAHNMGLLDAMQAWRERSDYALAVPEARR